MPEYKPDLSNPIPLAILTPTYEKVNGVQKKIYPKLTDVLADKKNIFYGSFKSYGGTETVANGICVIEDTAVVATWFRPDIKSNCRIAIIESGAIYDLINEPENINMRNQFLKFKVRRIKGNA